MRAQLLATTVLTSVLVAPDALAQSGPREAPVETSMKMRRRPVAATTLLRVADLRQADVRNHGAATLGQVDDLILDLGGGQVGYLLIETGGFLNIGEQLHVVPWSVVASVRDDLLLLDLEPEVLDAEVSYEREDLPDFADRELGTALHSRFDRAPYWTVYQARRPEDRGSGGWGPRTRYGRLYDPETVQRLEGTVLAVDRIEPLKGMAKGLSLRLHTDRGDRVVHLGPTWFIERQDFDVVPGDELQVTASAVQIGPASVYLAAELVKESWTLRLREPDTGHPLWTGWRSGREASAAERERTEESWVAPAEQLTGMQVLNGRREVLGTVADVVIDRSGNLVYVLVQPAAGAQDPVAVPWTVIEPDRDLGVLRLDVPTLLMAAAPRVEGGNVAALTDARLARELHRHFGADPHRAISSYQRWWDREDRALEARRERIRHPIMTMPYDVERQRAWSGPITDLEPTLPSQPMLGLVTFRMQTAEGPVVVCLGPAWYVHQQEIPLAVDARVEVRGAPVTFEGRQVVLASQITVDEMVFLLRDDDGFPRWSARGGPEPKTGGRD